MTSPPDPAQRRAVGVYDRPAFWQNRRFWIVAIVTIAASAISFYFFSR